MKLQEAEEYAERMNKLTDCRAKVVRTEIMGCYLDPDPDDNFWDVEIDILRIV